MSGVKVDATPPVAQDDVEGTKEIGFESIDFQAENRGVPTKVAHEPPRRTKISVEDGLGTDSISIVRTPIVVVKEPILSNTDKRDASMPVISMLLTIDH